MTARELLQYLDKLPPEQLELKVYRWTYECSCWSPEEIQTPTYEKAAKGAWRHPKRPEGIYLE